MPRSNANVRVSPKALEAYKIAEHIRLIAFDLTDVPPEMIETKIHRLRLVRTILNSMAKSIYVGWGDYTD